MGSPVSQVASSTQPQGKGFASPTQPSNPNADVAVPQGKGGNVTFPGQGGQPRMGVPNNYSNTVGQWDNATIGTQQYQAPQTFQPRQTQSGKGKGY
jgi:hypothetical protein